MPSLRVVVVRGACLSHAQPVPANRLTMAPAWHPEPRAQPYRRAVQAYPLDRDPRPLDLSREQAPDRYPRARQHELAAEYSLDFQL